MTSPAERAAIAKVGFVACPDRCGLVELAPDEVRGKTRICHHYADCELYLHPDCDAALDLAEWVDAAIWRELCHDVGPTDLEGDGLPVHVWGTA